MSAPAPALRSAHASALAAGHAPGRPRALRVLIAIPVLLVGGSERHTLQLARALLARGYRVEVCCYYEHDPGMVASFERAGVPVLLLGLQRANGRPGWLRASGELLRLAGRLYRAFRRARPDVLFVQYLAPGLLPILVGRAARVRRLVAQVHQPGHQYGRRVRWMLRLGARFCDAFLCVSRSTETFWFGSTADYQPARSGDRRHFTFYNGIDAVAIERALATVDRLALRRSLGLEGRLIVGRVARLHWEKGHAALLHAMRALVDALPSATLLLVGDGPEAGALRALCTRLGLDDHVRWLGQVGPEEALRLYSIMDVLAVSSLIEGFGLTVLEGMAARLPIVASRVGGPAEVLEHGRTGLLVPPGDPAALADALRRLLADPAARLRLGAEARLEVERRFSEKAFAAGVGQLFQDLTAGIPGPARVVVA